MPLARVDVDFNGRTGALQVRGITVDGFTGLTSTVEVTRAEQPTSAYRAFAEKHPSIEAPDSVEALVEALRATYGTWANANTGTHHADSPALGIVGYPEEADLDEVADICERLGEQGTYARFVDICSLRVVTAAGTSAARRGRERPHRLRLPPRHLRGDRDAPLPRHRGPRRGGPPRPRLRHRRLLDLVVRHRRALLRAAFPGGHERSVRDDEMAFVEEHVPAPGSESSVAGERLGLFVFGGKLAGVFPGSAEKDIMGECRDHVFRGCLIVRE